MFRSLSKLFSDRLTNCILVHVVDKAICKIPAQVKRIVNYSFILMKIEQSKSSSK